MYVYIYVYIYIGLVQIADARPDKLFALVSLAEVWDHQVPLKVGLYHVFVCPHTKDSIKCNLFIVVSGSLQYLDEEFHRLWEDYNTFTTCVVVYYKR